MITLTLTHNPIVILSPLFFSPPVSRQNQRATNLSSYESVSEWLANGEAARENGTVNLRLKFRFYLYTRMTR